MQIFKCFPLFTVILVVYFACSGLDIVVATPIPNTEENAHVPEVNINVSSANASVAEFPVDDFDPQFYTTEVAITPRVTPLPLCNSTRPPHLPCYSGDRIILPRRYCRDGYSPDSKGICRSRLWSYGVYISTFTFCISWSHPSLTGW